MARELQSQSSSFTHSAHPEPVEGSGPSSVRPEPVEGHPGLFDDPVPPPAPTRDLRYDTILTWDGFEAWLARLMAADLVALDTETSSLDEMVAQIVGISFSVTPGEAAYIPLKHAGPDAPEQVAARFADITSRDALQAADERRPVFEAQRALAFERHACVRDNRRGPAGSPPFLRPRIIR